MFRLNYKDLNIHQRINWKNQFAVVADRSFYHSPKGVRMLGVLAHSEAHKGVQPKSWFWDHYFIPGTYKPCY